MSNVGLYLVLEFVLSVWRLCLSVCSALEKNKRSNSTKFTKKHELGRLIYTHTLEYNGQEI